METNNNITTTDNGKVAGIVSYFGLIGWLIAYFAMHKDNKTELGSYQLRQTLLFAIVSTVVVIALSIVLGILIVATGVAALGYIGYIVYIALTVIWIIGFIGAVQGEKKPMPLIGEKAQTMFSTI
ncbi:DUF4870 domain-containing protein [Pedobacter punctiformis]|uniref:DUF4870 domain-containing protein n=1 Tax=Pedobacter punctiformis TaxID=3004097 RepID=A0ABT4LCI8_9SPHI|nr:DUF4870 domain-containing protein [Pedobacter sp. HCMS5-2]MCZ4244514.1 DUF4870 domain-containing protein [Pedobacter sp. HCMS5-2]